MTTERIDIVVREDGSRVVRRNLDSIGTSADRAAGSVDTLGKVMASIAAAGVVTGLMRMADTFTTMQNKLRLVTTGTENLTRVTQELLAVSNDTRTDFEATATMYSRVAGATKEMGLSQQQTLKFVESLNQAIVLSGATAEEAAGGIRQLSQGLASGTLRGDELNSVMENFPKVADIIAESMGKTRGDIRALGAEGKISAQIIIDAFAKAADQLDQEFATTVPTIGQSFTVLKNNLLAFVGEMNESLGITKTFSELILTLANNLDILIPVLLGVGAAIATAFAPTIISMFAAQLQGLWALIAANPIGALVVAIVGVTTALYAMRDEIKLGIDDTTTLGDLMRAAWEDIGPAITAAMDLAAQFFAWLAQTSAGTFDQLLNDIVGYEHQNESTWLKILRVVVQVFDMIGGTIRGVMAGINAVIQSFVGAWMNNFRQLGNAINAAMDLDGDALMAAVQSNLDGWKAAGANVGTVFGEAFRQEQLSQADSGLEAMLDQWIKRAQEISKEQLAGAKLGELAGGGTATVTPPVDEDALKKAAEALKRLQDSLNGLLDSIYPVEAAKRQLREAQELLTKSVAAGLITQEKANAAYADMEEQLRDQLDPLGALNRELDKSIELLKMSSGQRQIEADLYQMTEQLKRDGIKLTQDEVAALRAKLVVEQELSKFSQARESAASNSAASALEDFEVTAKAMRSLLNDATSGYTSGDVAMMITETLGQITNGTTIAAEAATAQWTMMYEQVQILRDQDVINEQQASELRRAIRQQELDMYVQRTSDALGMASGLMKANSKEAFKVGQAAAIGQAIVNTYTAATAAYQSAAAIPFVGWVLGPLAAAGAIAAGMAQVSAIRSQTMPAYRTGGTYTVGGMGGTDSQTVAFRASPGEQVSINTPSQARAMERIANVMEEGGGRQGTVVNQSLTIVQQGRPNKKTPEQNARAVRKETSKMLRIK